LLETAVREQNGKVLMAKLDTDAHPQLAQGLKVQSLPTVYGVNGGKAVEQFIGLQVCASIRRCTNSHLFCC
jgi:putative thioredoxin